MAFFPEGQGRVKLLMLYIIKKFRTPVSREQLYTAMVNADGTGFFEMSELMAQLEQEMYVIAVPSRDQQLLYLTERGEELIAEFEREIPRSQRDEIDGYAEEHRAEVIRENCVYCDSLPRPDGSWLVKLALLERDGVLFGIDLRVPDSRTANLARENWLKDADGIYLQTLMKLTSENKEE